MLQNKNNVSRVVIDVLGHGCQIVTIIVENPISESHSQTLFSCEKQLYKTWVGHAFLKNREFYKIHGNSSKFNKIQPNLRLFATVGRVTALYIIKCLGV